jgi:mRNA interferase RelE/StbE
MAYQLLILKKAQKELAQLPMEVYDAIKSAILTLQQNCRPQNCLKLKNREGWRIRAGNYRVIYEINDKEKSVLILHVGHRRDVYQ